MDFISVKTKTLKKGFDLMRVLEGFFNKKSKKLHEGDVVIINSKIVALSQGKVVDLRTV